MRVRAVGAAPARRLHRGRRTSRAREDDGRRHQLDCLAVLLALGRPTAAVSHVSAARLWSSPSRSGRRTHVRLTDPTQWRRGRGLRDDAGTAASRRGLASGPAAPDRRRPAPSSTAPGSGRSRTPSSPWTPGCSPGTDAAERAARTRRRGRPALARRARAARAVALADGRAESPLETRGRLRIVGAGLPRRPSSRSRSGSAGRLVAVVDAWFDEAAVAVEFDGRVKYTDPWRGRSPERVLWDEKRREDELRALDIRVVRIADADLGARDGRGSRSGCADCSRRRDRPPGGSPPHRARAASAYRLTAPASRSRRSRRHGGRDHEPGSPQLGPEPARVTGE